MFSLTCRADISITRKINIELQNIKIGIFQLRSAKDIRNDPAFANCTYGGTDCVSKTKADLEALGLDVSMWATFQYHEKFSKSLITCPKYDQFLPADGATVFTRLVLPLDKAHTGLVAFLIEL